MNPGDEDGPPRLVGGAKGRAQGKVPPEPNREQEHWRGRGQPEKRCLDPPWGMLSLEAQEQGGANHQEAHEHELGFEHEGEPAQKSHAKRLPTPPLHRPLA